MKTDFVATGYVFSEDKLLLIFHKKLQKWLPVGGHIEADEVPDDAIVREIQEEVGLKVEVLGESNIRMAGNVKRNLKKPFHVNVHSVGDHDHCSFFYICHAPNPDFELNNEVTDAKWFAQAELEAPEIPADVREIGKTAYRVYKSGF